MCVTSTFKQGSHRHDPSGSAVWTFLKQLLNTTAVIPRKLLSHPLEVPKHFPFNGFLCARTHDQTHRAFEEAAHNTSGTQSTELVPIRLLQWQPFFVMAEKTQNFKERKTAIFMDSNSFLQIIPSLFAANRLRFHLRIFPCALLFSNQAHLLGVPG